jgi:hypothetical protein
MWEASRPENLFRLAQVALACICHLGDTCDRFDNSTTNLSNFGFTFQSDRVDLVECRDVPRPSSPEVILAYLSPSSATKRPNVPRANSKGSRPL